MYEIFEFVPKINFFRILNLEKYLFLANLGAKIPTFLGLFSRQK